MKKTGLFIVLCILFAACTNDDENEKGVIPPGTEEVGSDTVPADETLESALKELEIVEDKDSPFDASAYTSPLSTDEQRVGRGLAQFAFQFIKGIYKENEGSHAVCVSPYSAQTVLQMMANGAAGATQTELCDIMGCDPADVSLINSYSLKNANQISRADESVMVETANSMWVQYQFPIFRSFDNTLRNFFNTETAGIDFTNPNAAKAINDWCKEKTNGMINEIVDASSLTGYSLMIANAIHFKAPWTVDFGDNVSKGVFHCADGTPAVVDMMARIDSIPHVSCSSFDMIGLAYGNTGGEAYMMYIALPHETEGGIGTFIDNIDATEWNTAKQAMTAQMVGLKLPKFSVDMHLGLKNILQGLGLKHTFDAAQSDFSLLSPIPIAVSDIMQDISLKVDEYGSEAAAVTHEGFVSDSGEDHTPEYIPFHVDRPFFYTIEERTTGTILFMGVTKGI